MTTQQLQQRPRERHHGAPAAGVPGADLSEVRQEGQDHIDEGFDAVERALSGDSEAFLSARRQRSGQ